LLIGITGSNVSYLLVRTFESAGMQSFLAGNGFADISG
jgi:hypothetical protein